MPFDKFNSRRRHDEQGIATGQFVAAALFHESSGDKIAARRVIETSGAGAKMVSISLTLPVLIESERVLKHAQPVSHDRPPFQIKGHLTQQ